VAASDVVWILSSLWYAYLHTKYDYTIPMHTQQKPTCFSKQLGYCSYVTISPSHANPKNAVLAKQIQSELIHISLPQHSFNYHGKDSLALSFPCQFKIFSGKLIVFSQASYLGLHIEVLLLK